MITDVRKNVAIIPATLIVDFISEETDIVPLKKTHSIQCTKYIAMAIIRIQDVDLYIGYMSLSRLMSHSFKTQLRIHQLAWR